MKRKILSVEQASRILRCHPNSIRRWAKQGHLRYFRDRNGWRKFKAEDLVKFKKEELQKENWPGELSS
jgi:excisionase family DNA binding protein